MRGGWARLGLTAALWALPFAVLTGGGAHAGQPATLRIEGDHPGATRAAADTARGVKKLAKAPAPAKVAAKPAPTTAKTATVAAKPAPTVAAKTPTVAQSAKGAAQTSASAKAAPRGVAVPTTSKTASVVKLPAAPNVARAPGNARVASTTGPTVAKSATPAKPSGVTLAKNGGTTVQATTQSAKVTKLAPAGPDQGAGANAGAKGSSAAATPSKTKPAPAIAAPREDHVTYQYNALGRRDPFQSLMEGEYVGSQDGSPVPPDLGGLKVMGIVWGSGDQFAMVEDVRGDSYVLRRGDRVTNGFVEGLTRDAMIVNITVDGQSQSVSIPVTRKGDKSNANR